MRGILTLVLIGGLLASNAAWAATSQLRYRVVHEYAHDPDGFTEGLAICNDKLIESDGLYGRSQLTARSLNSGRLLQSVSLRPNDFGEGVTCGDGLVVQLTWRQGFAYVYDSSLAPAGTFTYLGEGWGLAFDGHRMIESDGTARLRFFSPGDFAYLGFVDVHDENGPVTQLNELEWANGLIYANIWHDTRIAVIDPHNGRVTAWIDCAGLLSKVAHGRDWDSENVLNGIAYDPNSHHFFITGKNWPTLFEIELLPAKDGGSR